MDGTLMDGSLYKLWQRCKKFHIYGGKGKKGTTNPILNWNNNNHSHQVCGERGRLKIYSCIKYTSPLVESK